jgi:1-deoxy-D-xylulose 5-phosphate reductoisomerase
MIVIYIYDLKITGKKAYNNLKRNFYYSMNKQKERFKRRTKSVIIVEERDEKEIDKFFKQWAGFIELYKIKADAIEQIFVKEEQTQTEK